MRWAIVAGVILLVAVLLTVIVYLPPLAIDPGGLSRTDWLQAVESLRTAVLQGLGGLALLGTLFFSARTLQLNRRGQVTERFTRAIEQLGQLGPEKMAVRLGGIYALEQIALDSEELHWPVMEVLTAFVQYTPADEEAPGERHWLDEPPRWERDRRPIRADLQAVATVIGRRPERRRRWERGHENEHALNLRFADLPRVRLAGAHLEEARLTGARLDGANLVEAHLERAWLRAAYLRDAHLRRARLEAAVLVGAHLEHAFLVDAHLEGADLTGAYLAGANLTGARMEGAVLIGAHLDDATITRAQLDAARIDGSTVLPASLRTT